MGYFKVFGEGKEDVECCKEYNSETSYTCSKLCLGCRQLFYNFTRLLAAEDLELKKEISSLGFYWAFMNHA
jgi:hypothetical protein